MGLQLDSCSAVIKETYFTGRLHVDSKTLEFRSKDVSWSVKVGSGTRARVDNDELIVSRGSKSARFKIGKTAGKWADKVLNPPSRAKKLGLKDGQTYWLLGDFDASLTEELDTSGLSQATSLRKSEIVFVLLASKKDLKNLDRAIKGVSAGNHVWAVWPKSIEAIKQTDVMKQAREHGLGPGKKIAFDDRLTAMRFTRK